METREEEQNQRLTVPIHIDTNVSEDSASPPVPYVASSSSIPASVPLPPRSPTTTTIPFHFETHGVDFSKPSTPETSSQRLADRQQHSLQRQHSQDVSKNNNSPDSATTTDSSGPNSPEFIAPALIRMHQEQMMKKQMQLQQQAQTPTIPDFRTRTARAATIGSPPQSLSRIRSPLTHTTTRIDVHSPTPTLAAASLTPSLNAPSPQMSLLERRPSQLRVNSPGSMTMRVPSSTSRAASSLHRRTPSISFFHISTPSASMASSGSSSSSSAVNSAVASATSATTAAARKSMLMRRSSLGLLSRQSSSPSTLASAVESAAAVSVGASSQQQQQQQLAPSSATAGTAASQQVVVPIPPPQFDAEDLAHFNPAFSQPTKQHHQRLMSLMASSDFASSLSSLNFSDAAFNEAPDSTTSTSLNNTTMDVVLHGAEIDLGAEQLDRMAWRLFESEEKARILRTERIFLFLWTIALLLNVDAGYILALLMNFYADSTPAAMMPPLPAMPTSSGFHSFTNLALLHTLNSFGLFIGGICSGPLLERVQQNKLLAIALTLEALFLLLVGVSSNSGVVLFCRFLSGVCSAPLFVYIPAWILVHAPSLNLQENWNGMFHATTPVGIKLGFAIGIAAALQQTSSASYSTHALFDPTLSFNTDHAWKWTFLIQAIVLFPLALAFLFLPRSLISTTISDRKPFASPSSATSTKQKRSSSAYSTNNSLNNTGNTGSTSSIMQELVRARVTAMQELHERILHPATAAFFNTTALDEFGDPIVAEAMHHPTLSHQPREERSPSMNLKKLTLNVVGSPTVGSKAFFPTASPARGSTVSTTTVASHSHTAQTPSVPSSQRVSSFQPIVTSLPLASSSTSASASASSTSNAIAAAATGNIPPTPAASISRSGRRFSRSDASPLMPLRNKTNSFPNLQALGSTRSDQSIHTPTFDASAATIINHVGQTPRVPPTPANVVEGIEVLGSPNVNMMSPMSTSSAATLLSQQLQSLVAASAVEDLSSPMSTHSADSEGVESHHLSLYNFFDSMDLSAFFGPRYRMVSWSWNPAGTSKKQSQQQQSHIVQPSHSYWNLTGSQSEEEERNRRVSVVEMLSMLSDQLALLLSNYLYVAMCFSICTLLFFISSFYFWLTPYMLYTYPSLHLSVVGLAAILIFTGSTIAGVWSGHLLMHRIEAALDQKYDLEMQQHLSSSSSPASAAAKEKQQQKIMMQQGVAESDRSGPLFDTVGRKSRQLTKHIFVAIMVLSAAFFLFALLASAAAPPSQSPVFAFILIFFLLLCTSALLPMMHWIMEAAIASHTDNTDLVGFALALSQIIYHLFGYALAPLFIGVIIDASTGGHDLTWAFQFCLYWSVPFVLSIAISAGLQWKECEHQRTLEDIQRSVFLTMGGHLDAAEAGAENDEDEKRLSSGGPVATSAPVAASSGGGDQSTLSYAHEHLKWQQQHGSRLNMHDRKESGRQNSVAGILGLGGLLMPPTHAHHHSSAPSLRSSPALPFTATPSPAPVHSRGASTSNLVHSIHDSLPLSSSSLLPRQLSPSPPPPMLTSWSRSGSMIATEVQGFATDYGEERGVTPPHPHSYSGGESMSFAAEDLARLRRDSTGSGDGMQLSPAYHHPHAHHHDLHRHASDVSHSPHGSSSGGELEVEALDDDEENFVLYGRAMQDDD